jgi:hypothetical protein
MVTAALAGSDTCALRYSRCQFPCAATNTAPGLACVKNCLAEKDRCIAYQKARSDQKDHDDHKNKKKQH